MPASQQSTALQSGFAPSIEPSVEEGSASAVSEAQVVETDGFIFKTSAGFSGSPTETISRSDDLGAFTALTTFPSDQVAVSGSESGSLSGSADEQFLFDTSIDPLSIVDGNATRANHEQFKVSTVVQSSDWLI